VYSLGTLFVSGIYVQIPCIKEIITRMMMMMIIIIIITTTIIIIIIIIKIKVTQITMDNRPSLQKLQNMSKMKEIMKAANEAMAEILDEKDLSLPELNHLIYEAATVITEEINGIGEYKLQTQRSKHPRGLDTYMAA
jgi:hypothetical protein